MGQVKKRQTTIYITDTEHHEICEMAEKQRRSLSAFIVDCVMKKIAADKVAYRKLERKLKG